MSLRLRVFALISVMLISLCSLFSLSTTFILHSVENDTFGVRQSPGVRSIASRFIFLILTDLRSSNRGAFTQPKCIIFNRVEYSCTPSETIGEVDVGSPEIVGISRQAKTSPVRQFCSRVPIFPMLIERIDDDKKPFVFCY